MGLLSWLFPSPEDRIRRAQDLVDRERYADARLEVMDIDHPEALEILEQAERALTLLNLQEALSWGRAGDDRRVQMHMELAETFRKEGMDEDFRAIR